MNKKLNRLLLLLFFIALIPSCELLEDCKTCSIVTYVDGEYEGETAGILYCGEELAEKENESPVTIGSTTTQWECY